ncbi:hypothetical protein KCP73_15435 [Salmonella enterica subsp. enterica]|nr:hypothetical protein KCP73_15435 [Salmonella enterica subsp. enterica]
MANGRLAPARRGEFGYVAHSDWVSMAISRGWGLAVIAAEDQKSLSTGALMFRRLKSAGA